MGKGTISFHQSVRWSASLFGSMCFLRLAPSPVFILICPSVSAKAALWIFSYFKKGTEEISAILCLAVVGAVCLNTLGSLMITCPGTCQEVSFLRVLFWEKREIEWEKLRRTEKEGPMQPFAFLSASHRHVTKSNCQPRGGHASRRHSEVKMPEETWLRDLNRGPDHPVRAYVLSHRTDAGGFVHWTFIPTRDEAQTDFWLKHH